MSTSAQIDRSSTISRFAQHSPIVLDFSDPVLTLGSNYIGSSFSLFETKSEKGQQKMNLDRAQPTLLDDNQSPSHAWQDGQAMGRDAEWLGHCQSCAAWLQRHCDATGLHGLPTYNWSVITLGSDPLFQSNSISFQSLFSFGITRSLTRTDPSLSSCDLIADGCSRWQTVGIHRYSSPIFALKDCKCLSAMQCMSLLAVAVIPCLSPSLALFSQMNNWCENDILFTYRVS